MAQSAEVLAHWHLLVDDMATSAAEFYKSVEYNLAARLVPDVDITRVESRESGVLSAKRMYARIARRRLTFDICAAPYGSSYFFSWWFAEQPPPGILLLILAVVIGLPFIWLILAFRLGFILGNIAFVGLILGSAIALRNGEIPAAIAVEEAVLALPLLGQVYRRLFKPVTYYSIDTLIMFQESVHRAVIESIDEIRVARGLQSLAPEQTRPTVRDILRR